MKVFRENFSLMFKVFVLLTVTSVVAAYGQNVYKDMLLSKYDDEWMNLVENDPSKYVALDDVMDKRNNLNKFKNMMIVKDSVDPIESDLIKEDHTFYIPRVATKRGAILSWALPTTSRYRQMTLRPQQQQHQGQMANRPAA